MANPLVWPNNKCSMKTNHCLCGNAASALLYIYYPSYPNAHWALHVAITTNVTTPHGSLYFKEKRKAELTLQSIVSSTDICKAPVTALLLRGIEWVEPWRALHGRLHLTGRAVRRRTTWPIHLSGIGLNQEKSHTMKSRIALHCCCICLFGVVLHMINNIDLIFF